MSLKKCRVLLKVFLGVPLLLYLSMHLTNHDEELESHKRPSENNEPVQNYTNTSWNEETLDEELADFKSQLQIDMKKVQPHISLVANQVFTKILLVTNWRSGGAFISSIIGSLPATLLHPQALKVLVGMNKISADSPKLNDTLTYLKSLLTCDFSFIKKGEDGKYKWGGVPLFAPNVPQWAKKCGNGKWKTKLVCSHPLFLHHVCKLFPIHVFKVDRLSLELTKNLLQDPELSYLKIVYLARDPRAIHSSRQQIGWCKKAPVCSSPKTLCQTLEQDFHSALLLKEKFPNKIIVARFEDLVSDLDARVPEFLQLLGLPMDPSVASFIYQNTSPVALNGASRKGDFGRIPLEVMNKWKHISLYRQVIKVQNQCLEALKVWRYKLVETEMDLPDFEFVLDFHYYSSNITKT